MIEVKWLGEDQEVKLGELIVRSFQKFEERSKFGWFCLLVFDSVKEQYED